MIFVIEQYLKARRAKTSAWEKTGKAWVEKKNEKMSYSYYDMHDYARYHPKPEFQLAKWTPLILLAVAALFALWVLFGAVLDKQQESQHKPKQAASQTAKVELRVGQTVQVVYGDFKDSVGEVVKVGEGSAIIKLTNSTYTKSVALADGRGGRDYGLNNGSLLKIGSLDNLVPYKEIK